MQRYKIAFLLTVAALLHAATAISTNPIIHLDASAAGAFETDAQGTVTVWKNSVGDIRFTAAAGSSGPEIVPECINSRSAVRFDKESSPLTICAQTLPELKLGSVHVFVVARCESNDAGLQTIAGMGREYPAFNLADDGRNFRLFTGDAGHQSPEGIASDNKTHLFEFDHLILPALDQTSKRSHWPGNFRIDGALCGKLFHPAEPLPLGRLTLGNAPDGQSPFAGEIAEVVIFNAPLDKAEVAKIRTDLARKWGLGLDTTNVLAPDIPRLKEYRVGPADRNSAFAYYGESPESPDGKWIAYAVYPEVDYKQTRMKIDLWVCDRNLENHRLVAPEVVVTNYHNGSMGHWIDNERFVLGGDGYQQVRVIDMRTGKTERGPYTNCWVGGISQGSMVLLHALQGSNIGEAGIYSLDARNGKIKRIVRAADFGKYYDLYEWRGNREPERWRFVHGQYSPDGSKIGFSVVPRGGSQYFFTADADGRNVRVFGNKMPGRGSDIPLHWHWYDNDHFYGIDQESKDGTPNNLHTKLWDTEGNYVRTLSGPANHTAMSYDRKFFAGDSFYYDDPSWLVVYREGETRPAGVVFEEPGIFPIWVVGAHVNPAFSRDGKRLYYKRPVGDNLFQAYYVDLTPILEKNE